MDVGALISQVRHNCDISDAHYWGFYSICGLLMRYRELYLSEQGLQPWDTVETGDITPWIQERESRWQAIEDQDFSPLTIDGKEFSPFDSDGVNGVLCGSGLLYGSGYGAFSKPTFFVASLTRVEEVGDWLVYYTERERCRDLFASPAMLQGRCIYIRHDIIRLILWERLQTMKSRQCGGALEEMFRYYGIGKGETAEDFPKRMEGLAYALSPLFVLHELGEAFEDEYSDEWLLILQEGCDKYGELHLRAVKDFLADTSAKGPLAAIIGERNTFLMTAYAAFFDGIRKDIFPEARSAFQSFLDSADWSVVEEARTAGYAKATAFRDKGLEFWRSHGPAGDVPVFTKKTVDEMLH